MLGSARGRRDAAREKPERGGRTHRQPPGDAGAGWIRHDISRRKRGMFDKFIPLDMDSDGDIDFISTRGNSLSFDGVFWLEQIRTGKPTRSFEPAREQDSDEMPLPHEN